MDQPALRRILLDLLATARSVDPGALSLREPDWTAIDTMAAQHRLQPLLHARWREDPSIPASIAQGWRDAYRRSAIDALMIRAELADCFALLVANGFAPIALKGAYLARYAYPEEAQRPLRDLDLLVAEDRVLDTFAMLQQCGYRPLYESTATLEEHARYETHMPALLSPRGAVLELHVRLVEMGAKLEFATPTLDVPQVLASSICKDGIVYPSPDDMLAHLIIHAIYGHRFDCGPLLLSDVHFLASRHAIDWDRFWSRTAEGGWQDGARLIVELVRYYHGNAGIEPTQREPAAPPRDIVEMARDLMLQDYTRKKPARFFAALLSGGFSTVLDRMTGTVRGDGQDSLVLDRARDGGRMRWAWGQAREMVADLANPAVRRQARDLARLNRWLGTRD